MPFPRPSDVKILSQAERLKELFNVLEPSPESVREIFAAFEGMLAKTFASENAEAMEISRTKTFISQLPTGRELGEFHVLSVSHEGVTAQLVQLEKTKISINRAEPVNYVHEEDKKAIQFGSVGFSASCFLKAAIEAIKKLIQSGPPDVRNRVKFVLSSTIPLELESITSATFCGCSDFEPIDNEDPVGQLDIIDLLNIGLPRQGVNATIIGACNYVTSVMVGGSYERPLSMPRCLMSIEIGDNVNVAFLQPNPEDFGLNHSIWDIEVADFTGVYREKAEKNYRTVLSLPLSPVDLEIHALNLVAGEPSKLLEQIVALKYLPETCRKLIVNTFQDQTPATVWTPDSLTAEASLEIFSDLSPPTAAQKVLESCWGWKAETAQAEIVHRIVAGVFSRSAAIAAIVIAAVAKRTGRMQPALGGVYCGTCGLLGTNEVYQGFLRQHLDAILSVFSKKTTASIHFVNVADGGAKGAAVLNCMLQNKISN